MATSKDYSRSLVASSDEVKEIYCEPCQDGGEQIVAEGFCVDCEEYLCGECFKSHTRFKAFKHHLVQDKDSMPRDSKGARANYVCVERCCTHPTKTVEYFCRSCDILGCHVCITIKHRRCENVDHIPDIAKEIDTNKELQTFLSDLESKLAQIKEGREKIQLNKSISNDIKKQGRAELKRNREEILKFFDRLQADMDKRIEEIDHCNKQSLQAAIRTADSIYNDLTEIQADVKSKQEANQKCELFIAMKKIKPRLDKLDEKFVQLGHECRIQRFSLIPSNHIKDITANTKEISRLITAKFVSNLSTCSNTNNAQFFITNIEAIKSNYLAILYFIEKTIIVIDMQTTQVVSEIVLQCQFVWSMTKVNDYLLAVLITDYSTRSIQFIQIDSSGYMTKNTLIKLNQRIGCNYSILFQDEKFFTLSSKTVHLFNMAGNFLESIFFDFATVHGSDMAISPDGETIYVTNPSDHTVASLTLDGKVKAIYKNKCMRDPRKITVDNEGFIYVCCEDNVYQLSGDLSYGHILLDDKSSAITYCYTNHRLYLGRLGRVKIYETNS